MHFEEGGLTRWIIFKLGYDTVRPSIENIDQVRRTHDSKYRIIRVYTLPWKFAKVRVYLAYALNTLKHFKRFKWFERFKRVERF